MYSTQHSGTKMVNFEGSIKKIHEVKVPCSEVPVLHGWLDLIDWGSEFPETQKNLSIISVMCVN